VSIRIFYDNTSYRIKGWKKVVRILNKVIAKEGKISGDLSYIITNDEELRKINTQFLEHDYFTDVITFNYNDKNYINGEVYISLDSVKENALNYNVSLNGEIRRVMIHGVLHLVGYDDKTEAERNKMREQENFWLSLLERE
jgi:probable rRNA maturation factor